MCILLLLDYTTTVILVYYYYTYTHSIYLPNHIQISAHAVDVPHLLTHPELTSSLSNIPRINPITSGDYRDYQDQPVYEDEYSADQWL